MTDFQILTPLYICTHTHTHTHTSFISAESKFVLLIM